MESEEISMRNKKGLMLMMLLLIPGMLFSASCAKKTIAVGADQPTITQGGMDDAEAARMKELERQKAIEEENLKEAALRELEMGEEMKIKEARDRFINEDVLFDFDTASLMLEAQQILKIKSKWLKENQSVSVMIEGHCDERGTNDYNIALGDRRANGVKSFLMDMGISPSRMNTISYGEEKPKDPGQNEGAWVKNRRAHFVIN
jgi:peptidoglycan-associated lipoprotein